MSLDPFILISLPVFVETVYNESFSYFAENVNAMDIIRSACKLERKQEHQRGRGWWGASLVPPPPGSSNFSLSYQFAHGQNA